MDFDNLKRTQAAPGGWLHQLKEAVSGHKRKDPNDAGLRWHLDYPISDGPSKMEAGGTVVQGWVLLPACCSHDLERVRVIAYWGEAFELIHPLGIQRPDVITRVLQADANIHPQLACGFRFTVPRTVKEFGLALLVGEERFNLEYLRMEEDGPATEIDTAPLKVLEGKEGWLFLDNDTNGSVDQYRGYMRLTEEGLAHWQAYLKSFNELAKKHETKNALLVAPSKESVMGPRYHPFPEGEGGPVHQLLALPEAAKAVYPVAALTELGDKAFIQTDTHWAQRGAMSATVELAKALELDMQAVAALFEADSYKTRRLAGDLGSKFSPEKECEIEGLTTFSYHKHRYFDNGLPNFGRLLLINYAEALNPATCLVFGSSSSYSMLNYLSRLFERVIFVHTAGNLDPELVAAVKPAYLVAQTNARFVVQVPKANQALKTLIEDKRARLTTSEQELLAKRQVVAGAEDGLVKSLGLSSWVML
ncbi:alginate O-acetyltransferase AlgX-related protein [Vreelandella sp. EE7]